MKIARPADNVVSPASALSLAFIMLFAACSRDDGAAPAVTVDQASATVAGEIGVGGPSTEADFVGSDACADCHPGATRLWTGSHHDLAMQRVTSSTVLGDFDGAEFAYAGTTTRFGENDGSFFVTTDGPDGKLATYEIAYVFGVDPLQQYLVEFPDGRVQALGIAWDTRPAEAGGQRWFHLYPDEAVTFEHPLHWTGRQQNWNYMCADCHVTGFRKNYDAATDSFDSRFESIDVGCEACHGPGSIHVARARADTLSGDDGLVVRFADPGRVWHREADAPNARLVGGGTAAAQTEACGRCHARRAPVGEYYLHGRPLMDSYLPATLREPLYHADGQIRDEVYVYGSFLQSRMHAAGVVCTDCHEAHSLERLAEGDALCARCHAPTVYAASSHHRHGDASSAPECVDCHMPEQTYMVVDDRRDHSFRVPRPDLADRLGVTDACAACHDDRPPGWTADAVRGWLGRDAQGLQRFGPAFRAAWMGAADAVPALVTIAGDGTQPAIVRATALEYLGDHPGPAAASAGIAALGDSDPMVRRAALAVLDPIALADKRTVLFARLDDPVLTVRSEAARQLAALDPSTLTASNRARLTTALGEYVAGLEANGDRPESWLNLAAVYAAAGQPETAERYLRSAIDRGPDFEPAYVNLADLFRARGLEGQAAEVLEEGLEALPDGPALHHSRGLQLVRTDGAQAALPLLRKAVELAPDNTRYRYVLAVALYETGEPEQALAELEEAYGRRPADVAVVAALASYYADLGETERALAYAREWVELRPNEPAALSLERTLSAD